MSLYPGGDGRADMRIVFQNKPPGEVGGFGYPDPGCLDNGGNGRGREDSQGVLAEEIEPVAGAVNTEGLCEFPGTGAEPREVVRFPPPAHARSSTGGLEGANEDKAVLGAAFDEEVQKPVDTVVEIYIRGSGPMVRHKAPGGRAAESVAGFVILYRIRLGLDDDAATSAPEQFAPDQAAGTGEGIAREKTTLQSRGSLRLTKLTGRRRVHGALTRIAVSSPRG